MQLNFGNKYNLQRIGIIDNGIDGKEVYFTIETQYPEIIDLDEATSIAKEYFCYDSSYPGGKFCDTVHITYSKYSKSHGIVVVYELYDN
jgi:hypothetical protein